MIKAKVSKINERVTIISSDGIQINVLRRHIPFGILEGDIIYYRVVNGQREFKAALKKDVLKGEPYFMDKNLALRNIEHSSFLGIPIENSGKPHAKIDLYTAFWGTLGVIAIVLMIYVVYLMFWGGSKEEKAIKQNQTQNAITCQKMMKKHLNYPSTFDLHFGGITYTNYGGLNYIINLNFSAKNAFGVESDFFGTCEVVQGRINSVDLSK